MIENCSKIFDPFGRVVHRLRKLSTGPGFVRFITWLERLNIWNYSLVGRGMSASHDRITE